MAAFGKALFMWPWLMLFGVLVCFGIVAIYVEVEEMLYHRRYGRLAAWVLVILALLSVGVWLTTL